MRHVLLSLSFAATCTMLASVDLAACGDKYLRLAARLGPGYVAEHRATVLIYMPADSVVPAAARRLGLQGSLKRAGHQVHAVDRKADLETALRTRAYDIVIADAAATAEITLTLARATGHPTLVPVFHKQSQRELDEARKQLHCLIASRERSYHAVAEIDHVMQLRTATTEAP
jgi:hypothetical protein